jgi:predicted permease
MGAASGLFLGWVSLRLLLRIVPATNSLHDVLAVQLDWRVIALCAVAGGLTSLIFTVAPAILSMRTDLIEGLRSESRSVIGGSGRLRNFLVAGEIALSLVLLTGAAVFSWSLYQLRNTKLGFATDHIVTFGVDASPGKSGAQVRNEYASIVGAIRRQPGVYRVAYAADGLITGDTMGDSITVTGYRGANEEANPDQEWVTPGFFSTIRVPLLAGREFSEQDTATSQRVAIVDEAFVQYYYGGDIGKALRGVFGFGLGDRVKPDIQIVGVIPTIRATSVTSVPGVPFLYLPYDQTYSPDGSDRRHHSASFYISTTSDPGRLVSTVRSLVREIDRSVPIMGLGTMEDHISGTIFEQQMVSTLSIVMGGLALFLAAIGLYSLLAFVVTQRTHEIGIRMALGAHRRHVFGLVAKRVGGILLAGLGAGSLAGWAGLRFLASRDASLAHAPAWLFGIPGVVLVGLMLLAAALPARRAAAIDPMQALRSE